MTYFFAIFKDEILSFISPLSLAIFILQLEAIISVIQANVIFINYMVEKKEQNEDI